MRAEERRRTWHLEIQSGLESGGAVRPEPVGHHDSLEAPLLLQHADEQVPILTARFPAEPVVGGHNHAHTRLPDRRFEGRQVDLAQRALVHLDVDRHPLELLVVADEVLDGATDPPALHALHIGHRHGRAQNWVLGEALEAAATNRVPMDVDRGGQEDTGTLVERFVAEHLADQPHQVRIPGRAERGRRRQAGRDVSPPTSSRTVGPIGHMEAIQAQGGHTGDVPPAVPDAQGSLI